jgi:polysaccharide biosynthesis transport protein
MNLENRVKGSHARFLDQPDRLGESSDEIDLRALLLKLWRGKWILIVSVLLFGLAGYLSVAQIEPTYRATAKVMFDLNRSRVVNLDQVVVSPEVSERTLQNQIEILRSTSLIERVVDLEGLDRDPEFNPRLREPVPTLMSRVRSFIAVPPEAREILQDLGIFSPPPPPGPPPDPELMAARERQIVNRNVVSRLSLQPVSGSRVIDISFVSHNPATAARVANRIAEQYMVDQLEARLDATRAASDWLSMRLEELELRVQSAEDAVERARGELAVEAGQSIEITQQQLHALNASLSETRNAATATRSTYERLEASVRDGRDFGEIAEFREFRASEMIRTFRIREAELARRPATLAGSVPATHPAMREVERQLAGVRESIDAEALRVVEAARADWASQQEQLQRLEADVRELEAMALEQSRRQLTLRQLEREAQARRALYENFLTRFTEVSEQEELQTAGVRILSTAQRPLAPLAETRQRPLMVALVIGLFTGFGIIVLREIFNNTYRSALQLEAMTGEPVLGSIPRVGRRARRRDILKDFKQKPKSSLAEAVRSLRTSILYSNVDNPPHVVMFTSSVPREGKSTTAMLMAMTSRQMGKSAIIVDCDLRLPALARLLNADDKNPGLLSVLAGTDTLDEAIFQDAETGLHVLMSKSSESRGPLNAADVLSSDRFRNLIEQLKASYDLVILDTPPALIVADARIVSGLADAVVHVVRWNHTPRGAVLEGLKELRAVHAPIAGMALSLVNEAQASRHAYERNGYDRAKYKDYYAS